jgi:LPXTG-motif cell wall-anchored protein
MAAASPLANDNRRTRRLGRVWRAGLIVTSVGVLLHTPTANAQVEPFGTEDATSDYVPTTTTGERSLDVSAFTPVCVGVTPYISYSIKPIGFTSSGPATLTFLDKNGAVIETRVVPTLSGQTIYPGASVNPPDWPGWKQAPNGNWEPDPTNAAWRDGLTIRVEVTPVAATATVSYPPSTAACFGPPEGTAPTTTICVEGTTPGGTVDPTCTLPRTGNSSTRTILILGATVLAMGAGITALARRRRGANPA